MIRTLTLTSILKPMKKIHLLLLVMALAISTATYARDIYVVSVGIAKYKHIKPLRKTENDAATMAKLYKTHTRHVTTLTGSDATHDRVLATLKEVFGKAGKDDIVVFFFSGHGSKGGLCAYDTHNEQTLISYGEIKAVLRHCDANNKQLFIDACFSGGLRGGGKTSSASQTFGNSQGVMLFLSSRSSETSRENPYGPNGFFTQYLEKGMKGAADTDRNRIVEAKEIFTYVAQKVAQATHDKQHPVMWGKFSDTMHILNWNPKRK